MNVAKGTPDPDEPGWDELTTLFADISSAFYWREEARPSFAVRSQITEHLWRLGYRPPGEST